MMLLNTQNPGISAGDPKDLYGVRFTGNGYADLGWGAGVNPAGTPIRIILDITLNDTSSSQMLFASNQSSDGTDRLYIGINSDGYWDVGIGSTSWNNEDATVTPTTGRHVVILEMTGSTARLTVDGEDSHTVSYSSYTFPADFCLSGWDDNAGYATQDAIYHSVHVTSIDFLDAFLDFKLDEGTGSTLNNSGRASVSAVLNGTYSWEEVGESVPKLKKAMYINGDSGHLATNIDSNQMDTVFTVEASFKIDNISDVGSGALRIFTADQNIGSSRWSLGVGSNKKIYMFPGHYSGGPVLDRYRWYHAAMVMDGSSVKVYLDGSLVIDRDDFSLGSSFAGQVAIGGRPTFIDREFWGWIKEARMWTVARTQEQINKFKDRELTGREKGLLAYFPFFEENGYSTSYTVGNTPSELINQNEGEPNPQLSTGSPEVVSTSSGYAIRFDGSNDSYERDYLYGLDSSTALISARVVFIPRAGGDNFQCAVHVANTETVGSSSLWIGINDSGNITATIGAQDAHYNDGDTGITAVEGTLYDVKAYWDGERVRVSVNDGGIDASYTLSSLTVDSDAVTTIGASKDAGQYHFGGDILEAEIGAGYARAKRLVFHPNRTLVRSRSNNDSLGYLYGIRAKIEQAA